MTQTTEALFVDDAPAGPTPIIVDRSTLERYVTCPHQAWHIEHGYVSSGSRDTAVGDAVHTILSNVVRERRENAARPKELRELIESEAAQSRPDIQPAVIASLRKSWSLISFLCQHDYGPERSPDDILRFDGGKGEHSGQLAADIMQLDDGTPFRLTAEMDLLLATVSAQELELMDWKSGWKIWTTGDVLESFQFNAYPWLIFSNYPAVNRVKVSVWMTREGRRTSPVDFDRSQMFEIGQRLQVAASIYLNYRDAKASAAVKAHASPEACSLCPVTQYCKHAQRPDADLAMDTEAYLRQFVALEEITAKMKARLTLAVREGGEDLNYGDVAFGFDKPKSTRAQACDSYVPRG